VERISVSDDGRAAVLAQKATRPWNRCADEGLGWWCLV